MRKYFLTILLTAYFLGMIPLVSCNNYKCGGDGSDYDVVIDEIKSTFYLENNIGYDSLTVFDYSDLSINLEISNYHMATRSTHYFPNFYFGNVSYACDPVVQDSEDRITSINIKSTDTIITSIKEFLPGEDISSLFAFDTYKNSLEINKSLLANDYFLSTYKELRIFYRVIPTNKIKAKYIFDLKFQSGANLKTTTQTIQLQ